MKKFIVLFALLFLAGFTATLWAASDIGGYAATRNIKSGKGIQATQNDQAQVADKLSGEGETGNADHKGQLGNKGKVFPKVQFDHKVQKAQFDKKFKLDHKDQLGKKGFLKGDKGFHKGEKGFLKGDKGFHKGEKGFLKGDKGKNSIILQGGKQGKPNEIDDEVTWSKNKGLDAKSPKGKGFLKFDGTSKAGGAGNQMPAVK
jgi:hypothetical protein